MASGAEGNQVLLRIIAGVAAKFQLVDLKIRPGSARLTSPAITTQDI